MFYDKPIEGKYVTLKSATIGDADFTRSIRRNPAFTKFFPKLDNTVDQQKAWLRLQHDKPGDYFFVVWDKKGNRIGTISIYDVTDKQAESGRIAISGNAFEAIEAQLLNFKFAFDVLHVQTVVGYIFADNERALRFNKQFGGMLHEPFKSDNGHMMIESSFTKEQVEGAAKKIGRMLYR